MWSPLKKALQLYNMKHVKLFEGFLLEKEEAIKFSWKQRAKTYGKAGIGYDNSKRTWELYIHGDMVAALHNSGYLANNLGGDSKNLWSVMYMSNGAERGKGNLTMAKKFEEDQLEAAKKFTQDIYLKAVGTPDDSQDQNMLQIKSRIKQPVKVVKTGPFKDVIKILRKKLGDNFKHYIGTNNTFKPLLYGDNFDNSGTLTVRNGNVENMVKMIQDALGDEFKVEIGNREIKILTNEAH